MSGHLGVKKGRLVVAYQGEPGAFSEQAARKFFGARTSLKPFPAFKDVFQFVAGHPSRRAVVPIENSLYGSIHQVYDLLLHHDLHIIGETKLRIELHAVGLPGSFMRDIRVLYSQAQALGQCELFLHSLRNVEVVAFHDTAGAAKYVSEQLRHEKAAIASEWAAKEYDLKILKRNVEDDHRNFTRFIVLSKHPTVAQRHPKTSLVFAVKDLPGALFKSLAVFTLRDINLLKIESRPLVGRPWEYLFYLDVEGASDDDRLRQALNHLKEVSILTRVLGTYDQARDH